MQRHEGAAFAFAGWVFAATMLIVVGVFQIVDGLTAVLQHNFYRTVQNYAFSLDVAAWGWIHLVLGALLLLTGVSLMSRRSWAAVAGIVLAALSAINNFFFLPYYPVWSVVIMAADAFIIWSLARMLSTTSGAGQRGWVGAAAPEEVRQPSPAGSADAAGPAGSASAAGPSSAASDVKQPSSVQPSSVDADHGPTTRG